MSNLQVANTIRQQLGNKFVVMTGANTFVGSDVALQFRIGRNAKNVNVVSVTLNRCTDTYEIFFYSVRGTKVTEKACVADVYADALARTIGDTLGMAVSL
jgi:hypothetical protein